MGNNLGSLKTEVPKFKVTQNTKRKSVPNELQYGQESAYGLVAFKNQNPDSMSDLDLARYNFENKYQAFLNLYGQYSNVVLHDTKNDPITYPVKNFFGSYTWLKQNV
jgi:hypothetical protein